MTEHERDIFLWRWAADRKSGRPIFMLRGAALCGAFGAFFAFLSIQSPEPFGDVAPLLLAVPAMLVFSSVAGFARNFVRSAFWRETLQWLAIAGFLATLLALSPVIRSAQPTNVVTFAIYILSGVAYGALMSAWSYRSNETRYHRLTQEGFTAPPRRPLPGLADLKLAGVFALLLLAAFGPIAILAITKP